MFITCSTRGAAVLQALFVTFLWSTSWVLIKIGLQDVPPLTFAGLRYMLAASCLIILVLRPSHLVVIRALPRRDWLRLALFGIVYISVAQGAQFAALAMLPAITVGLLLNFTPVIVAFAAIFMLGEPPTLLQWAGTGLYMLGVFVYFYPHLLPEGDPLALGVVLICVLANAAATLMGRQINREKRLHSLVVTAVSMGIGAVALLGTGIATQGLPGLSLENWLVIGWLAVVNTAFAFTVWNQTQRTLSAVESSILNGAMLVQIALLAWLFLGESPTWQGGAGMTFVAVATIIVQLRPKTLIPDP
jgi:drug/metabolite transporter (DMT)-like permease